MKAANQSRNATLGNVSGGRRHRGLAFTVVELLVILAILTVLALVQLPALAKAKGRTLQAQCAANLKQFTLASLIYGNENNDRLPQLAGGGSWAWDLPWNVANSLLGLGLNRNNFYCPGFPQQDADGLWNFAPNGFRVIGYAMTFSGSILSPTNQNTSVIPQQILLAGLSLPAPRASQRVLLADTTISEPGQSQTDATSRASYQYVHIGTGFNFRNWEGAQASHLSSYGPYPAGGNRGMLDGHVEWTQFQNMIPRTSGNAVVFWW